MKKIDEGQFNLEKAEIEFITRSNVLIKKYPDIDLIEAIKIFNRVLENVYDDDDVIISEFHSDIESLVENVSSEFYLSMGEVSYILVNRTRQFIDYLIEWERENA